MLLTSELQMVSLFELGKRGSDTGKVEIFEVVTKKKTTASHMPLCAISYNHPSGLIKLFCPHKIICARHISSLTVLSQKPEPHTFS